MTTYARTHLCVANSDFKPHKLNE